RDFFVDQKHREGRWKNSARAKSTVWEKPAVSPMQANPKKMPQAAKSKAWGIHTFYRNRMGLKPAGHGSKPESGLEPIMFTQPFSRQPTARFHALERPSANQPDSALGPHGGTDQNGHPRSQQH